MKKQLLTLILISVITSVSFAQTDGSIIEKKIKRVGLQVGMNSTSMVFTNITDPSIYPTFDFQPRLNAGIYSETGASENFVFHIGLFYSGAGYKTSDETVTLDYVQVPMVFNFRTDLFKQAYLTLGGGFYGGYAFSGKRETDNEIDRDIISLNNEDKEVKEFYMFDFGFLVKADFEYNINDKRIIKIGASYNFGVLDASNSNYTETLPGGGEITYDLGAKNRVFGLNLTYMINLID